MIFKKYHIQATHLNNPQTLKTVTIEASFEAIAGFFSTLNNSPIFCLMWNFKNYFIIMKKQKYFCGSCCDLNTHRKHPEYNPAEFNKLSLKQVLTHNFHLKSNRLHPFNDEHQSRVLNQQRSKARYNDQIKRKATSRKKLKSCDSQKNFTKEMQIIPFDQAKWEKVKEKQCNRISLVTSERTAYQRRIKTRYTTLHTQEHLKRSQINQIDFQIEQAQRQFVQRLKHLQTLKQQLLQDRVY